MGTKCKTIDCSTCDLCGAECSRYDGDVRIKVNDGDGRDVGPAHIFGILRLAQPYAGPGLICKACKAKWLQKYLEALCL